MRNFKYLHNAFNSGNTIAIQLINYDMHCSNPCISYKLAFYCYKFDIKIYDYISYGNNQVIKQSLIRNNQMANVNNSSTLLNV